MRADRFTHTETNAGLYEFRRHDTVYGYYRPTRAEADRDECEHEHQVAEMDDWICGDCGVICEDDDPIERDAQGKEDAAIDQADTERKERD